MSINAQMVEIYSGDQLVSKHRIPNNGKVVFKKTPDLGITAKEWRDANPEKKGNIRDYATINELICLSNMENLNAVFINEGIPQTERLVKLNQIAIQQMRVLEDSRHRGLLQ